MAHEDAPAADRQSIACQACAKAKAKCDKKLPCSRCQAKRIQCMTRATRRSSNQNPSRRSHSRAQPDQVLSAPTGHFQMMQMTPPQVQSMPLYQHNVSSLAVAHQHHSVSQSEAQMSALYSHHDQAQYMLHPQFAQSPTDLSMTVAPQMPNIPGMEDYIPFNSESENPFGTMDHTPSNSMDFDMANMLDMISPASMMQSIGDPVMSGASLTPASSNLSLPIRHSSVQPRPKIEVGEGAYSSKASEIPSPPISPQDTSDYEIVFTSLEAWPYFCCNPINVYRQLPKTQRLYVESLARTLTSSPSWTSWTSESAEMEESGKEGREAIVKPIRQEHRERWLGIAQFVVKRARDVHRAECLSGEDSPPSSYQRTVLHRDFIGLPPAEVVTFYLNQYVLRNKPFYFIPHEALEPSKLLSRTDNDLEPGSLSLLFMIAQGASAIPTPEARSLAAGLTEACRISLFDMIEKDIHMASNPILLHSALLFINLAAWSGDKWQMDIATGQRGMYLAMLTHSGMLREHDNHSRSEGQEDLPKRWLRWREREAQNRLAYSWVVVDQELSLFADTMPVLACKDLQAHTPDDDALWQAESDSVWSRALGEHEANSTSGQSVSDLFSRLLKDDLRDEPLSPMQLRLLLHPLQAVICQQRNLIDCTSNAVVSDSVLPRNITRFSSRTRLEEMSGLLDRWCDVYEKSRETYTEHPETMSANLIMYNLIALNTTTSFDAIEKFARGAVCLGPLSEAQWLRSRAIESSGEAIFRCGQVFRLIKSIPEQKRPLWWAGAAYRASLITWAASMASVKPHRRDPNGIMPHVQLDVLEAENPQIFQWAEFGTGHGVLTSSDQSVLSVERPDHVLSYAIDFLSQSSASRLAEGVKLKLRRLASRWHGTRSSIDPTLSPTSRF